MLNPKEAAKCLRDFCVGQQCPGCLFEAEDGGCRLAEQDPCDWELENDGRRGGGRRVKEIRRITMTDEHGREWAHEQQPYENAVDVLAVAIYKVIDDNRDDLQATKELYRAGLYLARIVLRNIRYMSEEDGAAALNYLQVWRNTLDRCDWDEWEEDEDENI